MPEFLVKTPDDTFTSIEAVSYVHHADGSLAFLDLGGVVMYELADGAWTQLQCGAFIDTQGFPVQAFTVAAQEEAPEVEEAEPAVPESMTAGSTSPEMVEGAIGTEASAPQTAGTSSPIEEETTPESESI